MARRDLAGQAEAIPIKPAVHALLAAAHAKTARDAFLHDEAKRVRAAAIEAQARIKRVPAESQRRLTQQLEALSTSDVCGDAGGGDADGGSAASEGEALAHSAHRQRDPNVLDAPAPAAIAAPSPADVVASLHTADDCSRAASA